MDVITYSCHNPDAGLDISISKRDPGSPHLLVCKVRGMYSIYTRSRTVFSLKRPRIQQINLPRASNLAETPIKPYTTEVSFPSVVSAAWSSSPPAVVPDCGQHPPLKTSVTFARHPPHRYMIGLRSPIIIISFFRLIVMVVVGPCFK